MKLGIGSYTFTWAIGVPGHLPPRPMDAFDLLEQAHQLGAEVVQYCDNLPIVALSPSERKKLKHKAKGYGVDIEVGTRGITPENLLEHLELARFFGSPFVRVVIDQGRDQPDPAMVVARLKPLQSEFGTVKLGIENHDRFPAEVLRWMVEELGPDWVGIVLDTVNSLGAAEGVAFVGQTLAPYTLNLHIKDFVVRRASHQMGFSVEGSAAGQGLLNVPWLLDRVSPGINGILELWTPPQESLEATLELERSWAIQSMSYLKEQIKERS